MRSYSKLRKAKIPKQKLDLSTKFRSMNVKKKDFSSHSGYKVLRYETEVLEGIMKVKG